MSLATKEYLVELKGSLENGELDEVIKDVGSSFSADKLSPKDSLPSSTSLIPKDVISSLSSLGIGLALSFLATTIVKKKRDSPFVRFIAKLFGAPVKELDKAAVLGKLKENREYFREIQVKIVNRIVPGDIDGLLNLFEQEFQIPREDAMEVYLEIKDVILDSEIIGFIIKIYEASMRLEKMIVVETGNLRSQISQYFANLNESLNEQLKQFEARIKQSFNDTVRRNELLTANLKLVTASTNFGVGDKDCWTRGYFSDASVQSGYDTRREKTDDIYNHIEVDRGTILYGESFSGKTTMLQRIMIEFAQKGKPVILCEKVNTHSYSLIESTLESFSKDNFSDILFIADDVHKKENEVLFNVYADLFPRRDVNNIKFLFAAREGELTEAKKFADDPPLMDYVISKLYPIRLDFTENDAKNFLRKAVSVSKPLNSIPAEEEIVRLAAGFLTYSDNYLLMFMCMIIVYLVEGKKSIEQSKESYINFLHLDILRKLGMIEEHPKLWHAALVSSFVATFGMPITLPLTSKCGVLADELRALAQNGFLFEKVGYRLHSRWALEFIAYVYDRQFENDFESFNTRHSVAKIMKSIFKNISIKNSFDVLFICNSLGEKRFRPLVKVIVENFIPSDYVIPEYAEELKSIHKELLHIYTIDVHKDSSIDPTKLESKIRKWMSKLSISKSIV